MKIKQLRGMVEVVMVVLLFNTTLFITAINATHFRGGTVWWKPSLNYTLESKEIEVEYQIGWRITSNSKVLCSDGMIDNRTLTPGVGDWQVQDGSVAPVEFYCIQYDKDFDWMIGYNRFFYNVTSSNVTMWNEGRCWVSDLYYAGCYWSLSFLVNAGIRSDTGRPNSSPQSTTTPVIRMQQGCPLTITLPVTDPDGDRVSCRFGENFRECGDICQRFPYFSINEFCELTYNGGGFDSAATVAIVIEDHPLKAIRIEDVDEVLLFSSDDALSYVSLQFLVLLQYSSNPCNAKPHFVGETPPAGQEISTVTGEVFHLSVYAEASVPSENITDIIVLYPFGASKSALERLDASFRMNITWKPSYEQMGNKLICFTAKDSAGLSSDQRCIDVLVGGAASPCDINNGGCSMQCVSGEGTSYHCSCPRDCWHLDDDGRTCRPNMSVECQSDVMQISVPTCAVDREDLTVGGFEVDQDAIPEECRVTSDADFHNFTLVYDKCGMQAQETFWVINYYNKVRLWADVAADSETQNPNSPITRGAWFNVAVSCKFKKLGNLSSSFQPVERQVELLEVPQMGSFSFFLDFYNSSSFNQAIGPYEYPLSFTVSSHMYFGVRAVGGGRNLQVFTVGCTAFPNGIQRDDSPSYTMISEGCLVDSTMVRYPSTSPMENHFSIQAFQFRDNIPGEDGSSVDINMECTVMVCQVSEEIITRCSRGCTEGTLKRKKRETGIRRIKRQEDDDDDETQLTSNVTESPLQEVRSSGNIKIVVDVEGEEPTGDPSYDDEENPIVIVVACGVGGISLLLSIVIITIIVYHNKIIRSKNLITPVSPHSTRPAYVRDIYLPSIDLQQLQSGHEAPPTLQINAASEEYIWARRVISAPHPPDVVHIPRFKEEW